VLKVEFAKQNSKRRREAEESASPECTTYHPPCSSCQPLTGAALTHTLTRTAALGGAPQQFGPRRGRQSASREPWQVEVAVAADQPLSTSTQCTEPAWPVRPIPTAPCSTHALHADAPHVSVLAGYPFNPPSMYGLSSMGPVPDAYLLGGQVRAVGLACGARDFTRDADARTGLYGSPDSPPVYSLPLQDRLPKPAGKSLVRFPPGSTLFISNLGTASSEQEISEVFGAYVGRYRRLVLLILCCTRSPVCSIARTDFRVSSGHSSTTEATISTPSSSTRYASQPTEVRHTLCLSLLSL
jgi:hypothetical protein